MLNHCLPAPRPHRPEAHQNNHSKSKDKEEKALLGCGKKNTPASSTKLCCAGKKDLPSPRRGQLRLYLLTLRKKWPSRPPPPPPEETERALSSKKKAVLGCQQNSFPPPAPAARKSVIIGKMIDDHAAKMNSKSQRHKRYRRFRNDTWHRARRTGVTPFFRGERPGEPLI